MDDKEYDLLNKMVVKINEARVYNRISIVVTILWLIEFFFTIFYVGNFGGLYWLIWSLWVVAWIHMNRKYRQAMREYDEMKEEYNSKFENENF